MALSRRQQINDVLKSRQERQQKIDMENKIKQSSVNPYSKESEDAISINPSFMERHNRKNTWQEKTHTNNNIAENIAKARSKIRQSAINIPNALRNIPRQDTSPALPPIKLHSYNLKNLTKIVYTCITNSYDAPKKPEFITDGWRYILFTDTPDLSVAGWEVIHIENPDNLEPVKLARRVKTMYWEYLPEHDFNIWVDGNIKFINTLYDFCDCILDDEHELWITKHPQRYCVYQEANACKKLKKDSPETIDEQILSYKKQGMPTLQGLVETNVMLRKDTSNVRNIMEKWFDEIKNHSSRDQLSINYVLWKTNTHKLLKTFNKNTRDNYLEWRGGHKK